MSKTDLKKRPIFHRVRKRIEAHICMSIVAYSICKELERVINKEKYRLSVEKASELTHNMYQMEITLLESRQTKNIILKMDEDQTELVRIVKNKCDCEACILIIKVQLVIYYTPVFENIWHFR